VRYIYTIWIMCRFARFHLDVLKTVEEV